jgi:hypothetical protein
MARHAYLEAGAPLGVSGSQNSPASPPHDRKRTSAMDFAMDDLRGSQKIRERQIEITNARGEMLESISIRDIVSAQGWN